MGTGNRRKQSADRMALASLPIGAVHAPSKGCNFSLHESTELTAIIFKYPLSLLYHFKKAKKIKGMNYLLKQAHFLVLKSSVKKYKTQLQQELQIAALDSNGFKTVIKASS